MAPGPDNEQREARMIIDCHGHYTTAPGESKPGARRRSRRRSRGTAPATSALKITDDQIRESLEGASSSCSGSAAPT